MSDPTEIDLDVSKLTPSRRKLIERRIEQKFNAGGPSHWVHVDDTKYLLDKYDALKAERDALRTLVDQWSQCAQVALSNLENYRDCSTQVEREEGHEMINTATEAVVRMAKIRRTALGAST